MRECARFVEVGTIFQASGMVGANSWIPACAKLEFGMRLTDNGLDTLARSEFNS